MKPTTVLHAGWLTIRFDNGSLRYIRYGQLEVIRNLYFALRDQNWGTVPYRIEQFQQQTSGTGFTIRFVATHSVDAQDVFRWNVAIEGSNDSEISFSIDGEALQSFWRNRAGFYKRDNHYIYRSSSGHFNQSLVNGSRKQNACSTFLHSLSPP